MDPRIARTLAAMNEDCALRLTVSELAAQSGLSRSRFEHLLKRETGEGFNGWMREFRLQRARRLLPDCSLRVKEVAAQCGYSDAASFSREFRKFLHKSPSAYRRSTFRQEIAQIDKGFRLTASLPGVGSLLARKFTDSTTGGEGPRSGGKPDGHTKPNKQT